MDLGRIVTLVIILALILLAIYIAMSQSPIPRRIRRLFTSRRTSDATDNTPGPRRNPQWGDDPDQVNEAREIERVTGVIRLGDAITIVTNDPSHWNANSFEIEGNVTGVAEVQTLDVTGNFQFRLLTVNMVESDANTLIIEGDTPTGSVVYLGRAYTSEERIDDVPIGTIISQLSEERNRYRAGGAPEMATNLTIYEAGSFIAGRYEGHLALLESDPAKGYLPVSAGSSEGQAYADATVRLDGSGWYVRLMEVGTYKYLLELEPLKLSDLTVHHRA
jgi:hypothetical protein